MATITTISEGDLARINTKISLAVQDIVLSEKSSDQEWINSRIDSTARSICATLGIAVVNQVSFRRN